MLTLQLRPHRALTARGARYFVASVVAASFLAATVAAFNGAWPALVYAAIQSAVIVVALHLNMRERNDLHELQITATTIRIRFEERGRVSQVSLPRHWTRVQLQRPSTMLHPSVLVLESQGRQFEIGSFLTEADRQALAATLSRMIGPMGQSPAIDTFEDPVPH
jgi:uncharacterized membrane protein